METVEINVFSIKDVWENEELKEKVWDKLEDIEKELLKEGDFIIDIKKGA